mmetsp:Transcript_42649/g.133703  ORF Transcript_42649/g.133703 Transcript_42649/m.133703 type:complete len:192 (-) Transcript_42649:74-649(-)
MGDNAGDAAEEDSPLPAGWEKRMSKKRNKPYYWCEATRESVWEVPTESREGGKRSRDTDGRSHHRKRQRQDDGGGEQVEALHLLKKHTGSRRPHNYRKEPVTRSEAEAREEIEALREALIELEGDERRAEFERLALEQSECRSALRGGSLGSFGRGKMQRAFEAAAFALEVGELSGVVSTDSGIHIILRTA